MTKDDHAAMRVKLTFAMMSEQPDSDDYFTRTREPEGALPARLQV
jgi:hypothetical protein